MLYLIVGQVGSGKTLYIVLVGLKTTRTLVSNFDIYGVEREEFSIYRFLMEGYSNATILIDEIYTYLDARNSQNKLNTIASYPLFQQRKTDIDIYGTLQIERSLDIRYREMADCLIEALGLIYAKGSVFYKYRIHNKINGKWITTLSYIPYTIAKKLYQYYNTYQIIDMIDKDDILEKFMSKDEIINSVENIAKSIVDEYYPYVEITRDRVKSFLFKNKLNESLSAKIYIECKDEVRKRNREKADRL